MIRILLDLDETSNFSNLLLLIYRRFFHLANFEKKKKERATREAAEYQEKFLATVKRDEEALKKRSKDLELTA